MMQFNTNATKMTKRWIIRAVSMVVNVLRSEGIEHKNAMMLRKVINVV